MPEVSMKIYNQIIDIVIYFEKIYITQLLILIFYFKNNFIQHNY